MAEWIGMMIMMTTMMTDEGFSECRSGDDDSFHSLIGDLTVHLTISQDSDRSSTSLHYIQSLMPYFPTVPFSVSAFSFHLSILSLSYIHGRTSGRNNGFTPCTKSEENAMQDVPILIYYGPVEQPQAEQMHRNEITNEAMKMRMRMPTHCIGFEMLTTVDSRNKERIVKKRQESSLFFCELQFLARIARLGANRIPQSPWYELDGTCTCALKQGAAQLFRKCIFSKARNALLQLS